MKLISTCYYMFNLTPIPPIQRNLVTISCNRYINYSNSFADGMEFHHCQPYTHEAYKFYMEQHIENVLKVTLRYVLFIDEFNLSPPLPSLLASPLFPVPFSFRPTKPDSHVATILK